MSYIDVYTAAARAGVTHQRIEQLARAGRLEGYEAEKEWYVSEQDIETLRLEQACLSQRHVREALSITSKELNLLVKKGVLEPCNTISQVWLFTTEEVEFCRQLVLTSYSKAEVAEVLDCSTRTVHRLVKSGMIEEVETAHGLRVPFENLATYFTS